MTLLIKSIERCEQTSMLTLKFAGKSGRIISSLQFHYCQTGHEDCKNSKEIGVSCIEPNFSECPVQIACRYMSSGLGWHHVDVYKVRSVTFDTAICSPKKWTWNPKIVVVDAINVLFIFNTSKHGNRFHCGCFQKRGIWGSGDGSLCF